jgi:hypothetical protein
VSTRLISGALASAAIASLFVACSKGDDAELVTGGESTLPGEDSSVIVVAPDAQDHPPALDAAKDAKADADAGKKDADAAPQGPPPNPGDPCPVPNTVIKRPCGLCGHEEAMCLATEAGTGIVSDFAACLDQVLNGCIPGQTEEIACGNCGKAKRTCNSSCAWTTNVCQQPVNSCVPGTIEYSTAGCPQPNTFRRRDCKTDCTWGPFAATCSTPVNDNVLTAPTTVGGTQKLTVTLVPTKVDKMLDWLGGCPNTGSFDLGNYAYEYVEIKNPNSLKATVTIYLSQATGGVALDTIMAVYEGGIKPMTDAQRLACKWGVADQSYSDTALTGSSGFSIQKNVIIPANGSVMVWVSTYPEVDPIDPSDSTGPFVVNVRLDALN